MATPWSKAAVVAVLVGDGAVTCAAMQGHIDEHVDDNKESGGVHFGFRHGHKLHGPRLEHQAEGGTILDLAIKSKVSAEVISAFDDMGAYRN